MPYRTIEEHKAALVNAYPGITEINLISPPEQKLQILTIRTAYDTVEVPNEIIERIQRLISSLSPRAKRLLEDQGITFCLILGYIDRQPIWWNNTQDRENWLVGQGYAESTVGGLISPGETLSSLQSLDGKYSGKEIANWFQDTVRRYELTTLTYYVGIAEDRIDWHRAASETSRYRGQEYRHKPTEGRGAVTATGILYNVWDEINRGKEKSFARLYPILYKAWLDYNEFLEEKYQALLDKDRVEQAALYPMTTTAFGINDQVLTSPQIEVFGLINRILELTSLSPGEFDNQFRHHAARRLGDCAQSYGDAASYGDRVLILKLRGRIFEKTDIYFGCYRPEFTTADYGIRPQPLPYDPKVNRIIGNIFKKAAVKLITPHVIKEPDKDIILQRFSSGVRWPIHSIETEIEVDGCTLPIREIFYHSIMDASRTALESIEANQETQGILTRLENLYPQFFLERIRRERRGQERERVTGIFAEATPLTATPVAITTHEVQPPPPPPLPHELFIRALPPATATEFELLAELNRLGASLNADTKGFGRVSDLLFDTEGTLLQVIRAYYVYRNKPERLAEQFNALDSAISLILNELIPALSEPGELRSILTDCPITLAFLTRDTRIIEDAFGWTTGDERREYAEEFILPAFGIAAPAQEIIREREEAQPAPAQVATPVALPANPPSSPVQPTTNAATISAPPAPIPAPAPPPAPPASILPHRPDPWFPPLPASDSEEALIAARARLLQQAEIDVLTAYDQGYTRFRCVLGYASEGFPIYMYFTNDKGEETVFTYVSHNQEFESQGKLMTLSDAVYLKIAVQSYVLNEEGIEPFRAVSQRTGNVGVLAEHAIPLLAGNSAYREAYIQRNGDGVLVLHIKAPDRIGRAPIHVSFPLGISDDRENHSEACSRAETILDFIEKAGERAWLTKNDVMTHLQASVTDKPWLSREIMYMPNYERETHFIVLGEYGNEQIVTLSPLTLRMAPGGDNPSWSLVITFSIRETGNEETQYLRTHNFNLHTSNLPLAMARAELSLRGGRINDNVRVIGLFEAISAYLAEHPNARFGREGMGEREVALVGDAPMQTFFDNMKRYEDDLTVRPVIISKENGEVTFSLRVYRGSAPVIGRDIKTMPEELKRYGAPIEITVKIPEEAREMIEPLAQDVSDAVAWAATEHYSAIAVSDDSESEEREKHKPGYRAARAGIFLRAGSETALPRYFGRDYTLVQESRPRREEPFHPTQSSNRFEWRVPVSRTAAAEVATR